MELISYTLNDACSNAYTFFNISSNPFRAHTDGRTPWTSDQPVSRPLPTHRTTQTQNKSLHTPNIYALSGFRTHDPSVRASEDSSCIRPRGYCDRKCSIDSTALVGPGRFLVS
jgi:hypothetical protein